MTNYRHLNRISEMTKEQKKKLIRETNVDYGSTGGMYSTEPL